MTVAALLAVVSLIAIAALAAPLAAGASRTPIHAVAAPQRPDGGRRLRQRGRRRERLLDEAYPDALDLFVVSVQAGHLPFEALLRIKPYIHPIIGAAIDDVARRVQVGERLVEALDALVQSLGTRALAFVATVGLAERTGLAIGPMIERIGDDARQHRRRRAEMGARELPVRLAMPLVLCTLPSFVLVAIAPLLIGALSSLRGT